MTAFDKAFTQVQTLVQKFDRDIKHYMSAGYSEAESRQDFIDNFFIALGWDVNHQTQTNPYEQEVKIERSQKQQNESARKRADYAFYFAPNFKDEVFFVEAKKPSVLITRNEQHYFQTIRYGWNAGCPISVLTDFEEFIIVDCRAKPNIKYALNGQHKTYKYTDYSNKEKFAEIYWLFSREAVANKSIEKYAATLGKAKGRVTQKALFKGGYQTIDDSFLEYIDAIRLNLAQAFKKNDDSLEGEQLTEAVQRTVDRLVFIRFLEDKFIEAESHVNEWNGWKDFIADCRKLDAKYNGIVFKKHFIDEQDFVVAEEDLFKEICQDISSLNSPYDFNYIPIHILGSIYERFLGKVIRTTAKRVYVEEKPEVRKAGGVYYTPKYIVDYIVQNTVGKIIQGKTPKQISELHFADIACGSGSFLIGVYDCLLDYHRKYYLDKLQGKTEIDKRSEDFGNVEYINNQWTLTLKLKQDILLNNIYGVDIDYQAVEVTQLSLFLKMLEDESLSSIGTRQGRMFAKVLPDLTKNIVCGNSLIGYDIMSMNGGLFEDVELKKLNPMDYTAAFPKIMRSGGFDAIVGNPPYVNIENLDENTKSYFFQHYKTCKGRTDIYIPFIEKDLQLLKEDGLISYIIPYAFTNQNYGAPLRKLLAEQHSIKELLDTSNYYVFKQAVVKNITITIQKKYSKKNKTTIKSVLSAEDFENKKFKEFQVEQTEFLKLKENRFETKPIYNLLDLKDKIWHGAVKLETLCLVAYGARLNHKTKDLGKEHFISKEYVKGYKPFLEGKNIERYAHTQFGWLNYKPDEHYNSMFPELFENEKLVFINVVKDKLRFSYDNENFYNSHTVINCVKISDLQTANHTSAKKAVKEMGIENSEKYSIKYFLGLLNSTLITWYFYNFQSESLHFYPNDAKTLPIAQINFNNQQQKSQHDSIVNCVTQLLAAKQKLSQTKEGRDKEFLTNQCNALDTQIDNLVYELYGLTNEEIKIVENE